MGQDIAQICLNGHVVNGATRTYPELSKAFCDRCGQKAITSCVGCEHPIRGADAGIYRRGRYSQGMSEAPYFCEKCGSPFPWTESKLEAARALAEELQLDVPEKILLDENIEDLIRDSPKAPAAAARFRRVVTQVKPELLDGFRQVFWGIVSERVSKLIFGG